MSFVELQDLILPWLDITTLMNLRQTCRSTTDAIQSSVLQTFDHSLMFVQSSYEKEADAFRSGYLSMDSWKCKCGESNALLYEMSGSVPNLSELLRNICQRCGSGLEMYRLFVGQLKRDHTLPSILWTIRMLCPEVQVITVENRVDLTTQRNKGCCWITVIDWTAEILLSFHRRVFFDILAHSDGQVSGFWVVPNHNSWKAYLEQIALRKRPVKCRSLPRKPVVVEIANLQMKNESEQVEKTPEIWEGFSPSFQKSFERALKITQDIKHPPEKKRATDFQKRCETKCISDFALTPRRNSKDVSPKRTVATTHDTNTRVSFLLGSSTNDEL